MRTGWRSWILSKFRQPSPRGSTCLDGAGTVSRATSEYLQLGVHPSFCGASRLTGTVLVGSGKVVRMSPSNEELSAACMLEEMWERGWRGGCMDSEIFKYSDYRVEPAVYAHTVDRHILNRAAIFVSQYKNPLVAPGDGGGESRASVLCCRSARRGTRLTPCRLTRIILSSHYFFDSLSCVRNTACEELPCRLI